MHSRPYIRFQDPELRLDGEEVQGQRVITPLIGWQLAFDGERRQAGELRRSGLFVGLDLLGSHEELGSDVTSFGVVGQLRYFWPLGSSTFERFTWAQFWRAGRVDAREGFVPLIDRFRAGGEFSVRGYPTNSLGPTGPENIAVGGELLFIVNQEIHADVLRTERYGALAAVAFFDAGNVWLNRRTFEADLFTSVGVGLRYRSPVGPLRLDFAVPLDRRPSDPSAKLYFGFGSVF